MKPFRLATVERLRERQAQLCVQQLHAAGQRLAEAQAGREALLDGLQTDVPVGLVTPSDLVVASFYRERLRGDIRDGDAEIARRAETMDQRRLAWLAANTQLRAITALHDRHRAARRALVNRREQLDLDELASTHRSIMPELDDGEGETP